MINKIWTILNRGDTPTSPYGRKMTPQLFANDWPNQRALDILVPFSAPVLDQHFRIEQLVQGLLKSSVREQALAYDTLTTYEKASITYPEPGFVSGSVYSTSFPSDVSDEESFSVNCILDPVAQTFQVEQDDPQTFTITGQLTSKLELPQDKFVQFRGPFVGTDRFLISYNPYLKVPWMEIATRLEFIDIDWSDKDLRDVWLNDHLWLNRVSAVVLQIAQGE